MKKGIVFLIVFLMVISFPICGYAKGKEKIYLDPSWKYADHAKITSGYAVMYKAKKNRKDIVIAVNVGHMQKKARKPPTEIRKQDICKKRRGNLPQKSKNGT